MNPEVSVSDGLRSELAKCKPGETKSLSIQVSMAQDGKVTLNAGEAYRAPKPKSSRPAAVEDALKSY